MNGQKEYQAKIVRVRHIKIEIFICRSECGYKIEFEFDRFASQMIIK